MIFTVEIKKNIILEYPSSKYFKCIMGDSIIVYFIGIPIFKIKQFNDDNKPSWKLFGN